MGLQLYLNLLSQPCRAVYIFAKKNRIPFELKTLDYLSGQHLSEDFGRVNSLKRLPALKDGDFTLAEGLAILLYLSRKYNTADHWYPSDLQARARVDEYLSWHFDSVRGTFGTLLWIRVLAPLIDIHLPEEAETRNLQDQAKALQHLEEKFLQDRDFIAGDHISLADLMAIVELMQPVSAGHDLFEGRPKLAAWRGRVEAALGRELFQEAHASILPAKDVRGCQIPPAMRDRMLIRIRKIV
ncbi:glutathione S-transferase theta-2-like [Tachyglossus aculeatus]|uniref:glutathione S-transferase theta-2-like n=1 Tax=Tachyglossus aculeatus TaxID=9261 RepID=UPI0018F51487|nr:glutathione S-transferase theta-2-like [Tachyglossus aculeatus]